jgi:DNA-binding winged helix-turn-helix (wHTH) protein/tetratricopeptide (TPR) repeat protein
MTDVGRHARLGIGDLLLDVEAGSLMRGREILPLPPRTFELLLELARRYPDHVRRRDLMASVWPDEVVSDETLSQRVLLLRRALGDDTAHPRYVASDRGWGYRLVATVRVLQPPAPARDPAAARVSAWAWRRRLRPWAWGAAGAAGTLLALAFWRPESLTRRDSPIVKVIEVAPIRVPASDVAAEFIGERLMGRFESGLRSHPSLQVRRAAPDGGPAGPSASAEPAADGRMDGTMSVAGSRLLLTLVLSEPRSARVLWQRRFTGSVHELFDAEDELVEAALTGARQAFHVPPQEAAIARADDEAARLCLRGEWLTRSAQPASVRGAVIVYKQALQRDPGSAAAHAGLALAYTTLTLLSEVPARETEAPAREAAGQAGRLAPQLPRTWLARGLVHLVFDADLARAEPDLRRAVEAGDQDAVALAFYAFYLQAAGRADESVPLLREAQELDPVSAPLPYLLGRALHLGRRCAMALEAYGQALSLDPHFEPALFAAAECHSDLGQTRAARAALRRDLGLRADASALVLLDAPRGSGGRAELWAGLCESEVLRPREPVSVARACVRGHRNDLALEWLERAARERSPALLTVIQDPLAEPILGEVRFHEVLVKGGLRLPPG